MSVQSQIDRIEQNVANTYAVLAALGADMPTEQNSDNLARTAGSVKAVPDYVVTEAESVIDRVVAAQGNRTFTFAAIGDFHYGESSYLDGVRNACQALKYIDSRIKLDAVAVMGDFVDGYPDTGYDNAIADFKTINSIMDGVRFAPNLRLAGNHDYYSVNQALTRRYINAYSDGATWGDISGGYYYRDFDGYKVRVICVNTVETGNSNIGVSLDQYNWFVKALNLSGKEDAEDWGILVLSHHPLDWYVLDSTYRFATILNAYKNGTSGTVGTVAYDFTGGKNAARLICNVHGHIHNFKVDRLYVGNPSNSTTQTDVLRVCTPNAGYNRENHYTGTFADATAYNKTKNSAKDTSFVVYCVDLDSCNIKAICYGAGYDREIFYGDATTYTITNNLTNITSNNAAIEIEEGKAYTATLTPTGSSITSVTVTMGGTDVTSSVYSNGVISIPSVTGDIVITAVGAAAPAYVNRLKEAINSDGTLYNGGQGWKTGYRLNSSGVEAALTDWEVTGFIPFSTTDTFYFKNIQWCGGSSPNNDYIGLYDSNFTKLTSTKMISEWLIGKNADTYGITLDGNNNITCIDCKKWTIGGYGSLTNANWSKVAYIRFSMYGITNDSIITKNQPIE